MQPNNRAEALLLLFCFRFYYVLRFLFFARTSSCVLIGFRTHRSWSTQGLFITYFISIEGNLKIVILSAITVVFRNKSQISPTLLLVEVFERTVSAYIKKREQYQELKMMRISWKVEILLWSLLRSSLFEDWIAACLWLALGSRHRNNALTMKCTNWVVMLRLCDIG